MIFDEGAVIEIKSLKNSSKNTGANENLSCGLPSILGIAPGVAPRTVVFALHSENYFRNSESCSENTPELSQSSENGLFSESLREFFS